MNAEQLETYEGVYVDHWEIGHLRVIHGRWLFGLLPRIEYWDAYFPDGFQLPARSDGDLLGPSRKFRMRVRARIGPVGRYGHRGICTREVFISEVLECRAK